MKTRLLVLLVAVVAVAFASPAPYTTYSDQAYGALPTQKVDVYVPAGANAAAPVGVVVWFHGDGWGNGTKRFKAGAYQLRLPQYRNTALASCDYRGETTAAFPAGLQDAQACIRYIKSHARNYNVDSARVAVYGGSHGGFLVDWLLVLCGDTAYGAGVAGVCVRGAVALYGAPDIVRFNGDLGVNVASNGCAPPDSATSVIPSDSGLQHYASALYRVRSGLAPSLRFHGDADCKTPWQGSWRMDSALRANGNVSTFRKMHGFTHAGPQWAVDTVYQPQLNFLVNKVK